MPKDLTSTFVRDRFDPHDPVPGRPARNVCMYDNPLLPGDVCGGEIGEDGGHVDGALNPTD